jgi:glyoxylase-like metal-dependent hydrolase (beta-lactamase superfamily II)
MMMRRFFTIAASSALSLAVVAAFDLSDRTFAAGQQPDQSPKVVEAQKVKDNLYVLTGGGGNSAVFITAKGVVVVDTKLPGWGRPLQDKIRTLTDKPVTTIINTHTHADHTSGNVEFPAGIEIVAHENTKANMARMDLFKGDNARFLPNKTYKTKLSLGSGADRVDLYYFGRGGTNGDTWVVFPALRTMVAGDAFAAKSTWYIDANNGGSGVEYVRTLGRVVNEIKGVDTIITGHGPLMTWSDMREFAQFNKDLLEWVRGEVKAGKSVDEAVAEYKIPATYPGYVVLPPQLTKPAMQAVFDELKK